MVIGAPEIYSSIYPDEICTCMDTSIRIIEIRISIYTDITRTCSYTSIRTIEIIISIYIDPIWAVATFVAPIPIPAPV